MSNLALVVIYENVRHILDCSSYTELQREQMSMNPKTPANELVDSACIYTKKQHERNEFWWGRDGFCKARKPLYTSLSLDARYGQDVIPRQKLSSNGEKSRRVHNSIIFYKAPPG